MVFDLFGTLLDVSSLREAAGLVSPEPDAFVATWRQKQLGYAFAATSMGCYEDFDGLTRRALEYAARDAGISLDAEQTRRLSDAWREMRPFADAEPCLSRLHESGLSCDVLTNSTVRTSAHALRNAGLAGLIGAIHSVDAVGIYKPAPQAYGVVTSFYRARPGDFVFVTSNGWDATGAAEFGMRVAWCNRTGAPHETFGKLPAWTAKSLVDVATAIVSAA